MIIPTEPIGSIPRPLELLNAIREVGDANDPKVDELDELDDAAVRETIERLEAHGVSGNYRRNKRATLFPK